MFTMNNTNEQLNVRTYTAQEAAQLLGVKPGTVRGHCLRLSIAKHGPAYLIDDTALDRLRQSVVGTPGRPWHRERAEVAK